MRTGLAMDGYHRTDEQLSEYDGRRVEVGRRRRVRRRRGLPLHLRPQEGHDHLGRREHLPGRDRGGAPRAPRRARRRGVRHPRRRVGRERLLHRPGQGRRDARPRRAARRSSTSASPGYKRPRGYELRDELPAHRRRQAPEAGPARRVLDGPRPARSERLRSAADAGAPSPKPESKRAARRATACPSLPERVVRRPPTRRSPRPPSSASRSWSSSCGDAIAHKTERGLVRLGLGDADGGRTAAATSCSRAATPGRRRRSSCSSRRWCAGTRELIAGLHTDPQFGPLRDARHRRRSSPRRSPTSRSGSCRSTAVDADEMIDDAARPRRCSGRSAASPPSTATRSSRRSLGLVALARGRARRSCRVDVNPLDRRRRRTDRGRRARRGRAASSRRRTARRRRAASARCSSRAASSSPGASSHPGKFGFVALHNILSQGYAGEVFGTNREGGTILGIDDACRRSTTCPPTRPSTSCSCARRPRANPELLRACARAGHRGRVRHLGGLRRGRGARAARPSTSSSRSPTSSASCSPGRTARASCRPRSQPVRADRRARTRRAGRIGDREPVRQLRVVVPELRGRRPASASAARCRAGNAAAVTRPRLPRVLRRRPRDRGRARVRRGHRRRPRVLRPRPRGHRAQAARAPEGRRDRGRSARRGVAHRRARERRPGLRRHVPPGRRSRAPRRSRRRSRPRRPSRPSRCRGARASRCSRPPAAGASSPPTRSPARDLELARAARRPARRDRRRSCRRAGAATTRSTSPAARPATRSPRCSSSSPRHPDVDAVVYLGLGIQSNQARLMRDGRFYPDDGLERIVAYHERQDERFARRRPRSRPRPASRSSPRPSSRSPIPTTPGPRTVRETGRLCYPSANRAVTALEHLLALRALHASDGARRDDPTATPFAAASLASSPRSSCVVVAVAVAARPRRARRAPPPGRRAARRPLWSARRVPQPIVDAVGAQRLQAALDRRRSRAPTRASSVDDAGGPRRGARGRRAAASRPRRRSSSPRPRRSRCSGRTSRYETTAVAPQRAAERHRRPALPRRRRAIRCSRRPDVPARLDRRSR